MEIAFYFYTILVMLVCIAAGTISLSAYFVCRKRSHLYMVAFFLFYFLDLALIFQNEYLGQNTEFPLEVFYAIDQPALRIFFALGILEALWLIALDFLGEKRMSMRIAPAVGFVMLSTVVIVALPEGQYKQWLFYSMRQVFLLWCLGYVLMRYRTTKSEIEKTRLRRHEPLFLITLVLTMCIILEDTFMMLVWDPTSVSMLPLYISERNFSENFLMLAFAFFSLREAGATLRLRFKEPPASENPEVRRQIDDLLPAYCERHGMTAREREILALVLQGKDNQNIASELQLALGTVKAHVHNILKKTDHASRQDLTRDFWKERDKGTEGRGGIVNEIWFCYTCLLYTSDRLGGVPERRVGRIHHGLRHDAGRGAHDAAALHVVQDCLRQLVADVALAHGAALGERHGRRLAVMRGGVVERVVDHADLRAVAVGDHDVDALGHHVHDVLGRVLHQLQLLLGRVAQGVAAQRDDDGLARCV